MENGPRTSDRGGHAFESFHPRVREGLMLCSRRSTLKASMAGLAGLSLPRLLRAREEARGSARSISSSKSVILLWMAGGPSHIDTWDVKPDAPLENRGPFGVIRTKLPGVIVCEHLPKQAAMLDKMTVIRSVDARKSNHQPNQVMQTANLEAAPRINREGAMYPAIASVTAKFGPREERSMPPYVALNVKDRTHIAWGGYLGRQFDPFIGDESELTRVLQPAPGVSVERLSRRQSILEGLDRLRRGMDLSGSMDAMDRFRQQAVDMVLGQRAREAFDLSREPGRDRERYGEHDWCRSALLARRLVERGVGFVTVDLSNHGSSGTWDTHGDNIPPYGGISKGLKPLLPVFDHLLTTLVGDLEERGLLDDVLVLAMGEFGRTPQIGTQGSTDGRNHWPVVMSMTLAGGGFRHGQVIGATEGDGGHIKDRPVTPADLAATIYHHMGVPLDASYEDFGGRPRPVVDGGEVIRELL